MEERGDERVGVDLIYFHTESDFQVPWCMMLCRGTPLWKAQVAPDRLKSWNFKGGVILSFCETTCKWRLATESVRGTKPWDLEMENRG